jgi:hypothetical protein
MPRVAVRNRYGLAKVRSPTAATGTECRKILEER